MLGERLAKDNINAEIVRTSLADKKTYRYE